MILGLLICFCIFVCLFVVREKVCLEFNEKLIHPNCTRLWPIASVQMIVMLKAINCLYLHTVLQGTSYCMHVIN